jgi:hypothetical protein
MKVEPWDIGCLIMLILLGVVVAFPFVMVGARP